MNEKIFLWPGDAPYTDECGGQEQPSVTEYKVPGAKAAVVVCPGGGYVMKAEHEGGPIAEMLNRHGVSGYVLDYRVKPCPLEAPLSDALRAIRVVRSLGYEKVGILGFSAGGHLTCSAATLYNAGDDKSDDPIERLSSRPDAFIPCYAVVSFESMFRHVGSVESLLGVHRSETDLIRRFSLEQQVTADTPPAFIWHTADDYGVPVEHSLMLAEALSKNRVPFEMHIFPKGDHGLGLAEKDPVVSQWTSLLGPWLKGEGFR